MNAKQVLHIFGLRFDRRFPTSRMSGAPTPANGAAHIRNEGRSGWA